MTSADRKREKAIRVFRRAMAELSKLPAGYSVYAAGGTPCLMCGPSHDDKARPLRDNVVDSATGVNIDGGDW